MNEQPRPPGAGDRPVGYALSGAAGGFARTLLAQTRSIPALEPAVLCDVDVPRLRALCVELGYPEARLRTCTDAAETAAATAAGDIALVADHELIAAGGWDVLVEATGSPAHGYAMARTALELGRHVAMVSKEVDSVAGLHLARIAAANDVAYLPAEGDQPGNLLKLLERARLLGMDVVAIGKSTEYDLVYDPERGTVTQLDRTVDAPALGALLDLGTDVRATLAARADAVAALPTGATADYCEMAVVANGTGFRPDVERLHYPVARIAELADVYALREDGGVLREPGAVDVFSALRLPGEASFAGGEFVVLRTNDAETWRLLAEKGHVVSRDGRYAVLYLPFHLMGVETPATLLDLVARGRDALTREPRRHAVLAGRAKQDIGAGTVLDMGGHHHDVTGVQAVLLRGDEAPADVAPLYLAAHTALRRDVRAGDLITLSDLENPDAALVEAWQQGEETR